VVVADVMMPFFKIFLNGLRSDAALAKNPKTAGGWWMRWALSDGLWTIMQWAGAIGLLGAGIKELYDGISEYNKANYNVLPIGTVDGGQFGKRVVYLRFPREDNHRLLSGLLYEGLTTAAGEAKKQGAAPLIGFGTDQMPGLNPVLKIGSAWKDFLEGENPMDGLRGKPILTNTEWLAGGWPAYKGMLAFTAQNTGITNFVRWDPRASTTAEMALSAVPGLNTFLQTTDSGYRERQEAAIQGEAKQRAEIRVVMPDLVQKLAGEYYYMRSLPADKRTLEQTVRLQELKSWYSRIYTPFEDVVGLDVARGRTPPASTLKNLETASKPFERGK
jgi:hypothetical protein